MLCYSYTVYYEMMEDNYTVDQNTSVDLIIGSSFGEHSIWVSHSSLTLLPESADPGYTEFDVSIPTHTHPT